MSVPCFRDKQTIFPESPNDIVDERKEDFYFISFPKPFFMSLPYY